MAFDKKQQHKRMAACNDFFGLVTTDQKKEWLKLTEADRVEISTELRDKHGYNIEQVTA